MKFEIDIDYPLEKIEASRKRMESWPKFRYIDRVPVAFCVVPRYFTPIFKIPYSEIFKDVETHTVRKNFTSSKLIAHELEGKVQALVIAWGD